MNTYNKIVRDRIPEIIRADGKECSTRLIEGRAYRLALAEKLNEEVIEYSESGDPTELADLLEVIYALCAAHGLSPSELEAMRAEKEQSNGAFKKGVFLESVIG